MSQHKRRNRFMLGLLAAGFPCRGGPDGQLGPGGQWGRTPISLNRHGNGSRKLPASLRFLVLTDWNNAAVLDKETGLVSGAFAGSDRIMEYSAESVCGPHDRQSQRMAAPLVP